MEKRVLVRNTILILALLSLHQVLLGATILVLPLRALELGASEVAVGFLVSMGGIGVMLLAVPLSVLSDQVGRRPAIRAGFAFWVTASLVGLLAHSVGWLALAQGLIGVAQIGMGVCGISYLMELAPDGRHAQIQSLSAGMVGLGLVVGPALGGLTYQALGYGRTLVVVTFLSGLGLVASCLLGETRAVRGGYGTMRLITPVLKAPTRAWDLIRGNHGVVMALLLTVLGTMSWMTVGPSLFLVQMKRMELTADTIGVIAACMAGMGVVCRFGFALLARLLGTLGTTLLGWAIGGIALIAVPFVGSATMVALVAALGDGADKLRIPGIYTITADATEGDDRALTVALIAVAWGIANVLVPPLLGLVASRLSSRAAFVLIGLLPVVGAMILYFRTLTSVQCARDERGRA